MALREIHLATLLHLIPSATAEVLKIARNSLHLMYKVKLTTLAYKIYYDCTPSLIGHILTKNTSPTHHLRTKNAAIVPRFNTYFIKIQ